MFQVPSWKSGVGQGWAFGSAKTLRCPCRREKSTLKWIEERQTSYKVYSIEICTALRFFRAIWLYFTYDNSVCNTKNFEPGVHPAPKPSFSKSEGRQVLRKALLHILQRQAALIGLKLERADSLGRGGCWRIEKVHQRTPRGVTPRWSS